APRTMLQTLITEVATALGARQWDVHDTIAQLKAAWRGCVHNAVVADFWILFKGLAELIRPATGAHPLHTLAAVVRVPGVVEALADLVAAYRPEPGSLIGMAADLPEGIPSNQAHFICADLLQDEVHERFTCICVIEALQMCFSVGLEEA